jgi:hypothetical protein
MTDKEKAIKAIKSFNKKADEMVESTFVRKMFEEPSGVTIFGNYEAGKEEINSERSGPNREYIKAFVSDYRYFIQNNETTSFKNMSEHYNSALFSESFKSRFNSARNALNDFLDSPSDLPIHFNEEILTKRKILYTFAYGSGLAHASGEKEELFQQWESIPHFLPIIENEFVYILTKSLDVISFIRNLNLEALEELNK